CNSKGNRVGGGSSYLQTSKHRSMSAMVYFPGLTGSGSGAGWVRTGTNELYPKDPALTKVGINNTLPVHEFDGVGEFLWTFDILILFTQPKSFGNTFGFNPLPAALPGVEFFCGMTEIAAGNFFAGMFYIDTASSNRAFAGISNTSELVI